MNFLNYLANPMQQVPRLLGEIQITRAALGRIAEILAGETDRTGGQAFAPGQDPLLEVRNVSFGYGDKLVLDNLSFEIRRGPWRASGGQVLHPQTHRRFLSAPARRNPLVRPLPDRMGTQCPAGEYGHGHSRHLPLPWHHRREHRLGQARLHPGGDNSGGKAGQRP